MSWLARSITNSLKLDDEDPDTAAAAPTSPANKSDSPTSPANQSPRGVKEDLSDLKNTLTRQFWGVASFLAPPPEKSDDRSSSSGAGSPPADDHRPAPGDSVDQEVPDDELISGIRSDFAEISGKFRTGISKLSQNKAVWEFTKIASNILQLGSEPESIDADLVWNAVGVTEEALAFAKNIALHPETWLDFPLPEEDDDSDDFDLSDAQQDHALAIERLAPRLRALRMELCPGYMSDSSFWKIYFVLLHPRLSKEDAALLSTYHIMEARPMLMQELQNRNKTKVNSDLSAAGTSEKEVIVLSQEEHLSVPSTTDESKTLPVEPSSAKPESSTEPAAVEMDKHPVQSDEIKIIDKAVVDEGRSKETKYVAPSSGTSSRAYDNKYEDEADDWLKEETAEISEVKGSTVPFDNDEDVSFSDLEEDDDMPTSYKKESYGSDTSTKDSRDWVQLGGSSDEYGKESKDKRNAGKEEVRDIEIKESNDWLDVDDIHEV